MEDNMETVIIANSSKSIIYIYTYIFDFNTFRYVTHSFNSQLIHISLSIFYNFYVQAMYE